MGSYSFLVSSKVAIGFRDCRGWMICFMFADTCTDNFSLMLMEGLAFATNFFLLPQTCALKKCPLVLMQGVKSVFVNITLSQYCCVISQQVMVSLLVVSR